MAPTDTTPGNTLPSSCTLCYYPFSVYSIIMRFAFLLGQKLNPEKAPQFETRLVDLQRDQNLEEEYLTVNSKGQVPSLILSPDTNLTDSFEISQWLCDQLPELIPPECREVTLNLVREFYSFHARALTAVPDDSKDGFPNRAAAKLEHTDISEPHRRQLEIKSVFHDTLYGKLLDPGVVEEAEGLARKWSHDVGQLRELHGKSGVYIFGDRPSILDAYATVLTGRLTDLDRTDLIEPVMSEYAATVMNTDEWRRTTFGWKTIWEEKLGPVNQIWPPEGLKTSAPHSDSR